MEFKFIDSSTSSSHKVTDDLKSDQSYFHTHKKIFTGRQIVFILLSSSNTHMHTMKLLNICISVIILHYIMHTEVTYLLNCFTAFKKIASWFRRVQSYPTSHHIYFHQIQLCHFSIVIIYIYIYIMPQQVTFLCVLMTLVVRCLLSCSTICKTPYTLPLHCQQLSMSFTREQCPWVSPTSSAIASVRSLASCLHCQFWVSNTRLTGRANSGEW